MPYRIITVSRLIGRKAGKTGLQAKAEKLEGDAKIDYYKTIHALEPTQDEAKTKLQELQTVGDEAWGAVKKKAEENICGGAATGASPENLDSANA